MRLKRPGGKFLSMNNGVRKSFEGILSFSCGVVAAPFNSMLLSDSSARFAKRLIYSNENKTHISFICMCFIKMCVIQEAKRFILETTDGHSFWVDVINGDKINALNFSYLTYEHHLKNQCDSHNCTENKNPK